MLDTWNDKWPDDLKDLHREYSRAYYRAENLRGYIKRADPGEFNAVMDQLERAETVCREIGIRFYNMRCEFEVAQLKVERQ